jgi:dihydroflavonol-4-reductase
MVLVTGATGFIGSHLLLYLLRKGENVRAMYHSIQSISKTESLFAAEAAEDLFGRIIWVEADITDIPALEQAFQNISTVYHCAALVSFDPNDEERLRKINIEGTANIVNLCLSHNVKKLCHVSSIAAIGDLRDHERIITEETEWNPEKFHSDYAISKHGAEMEVWRAEQEGLAVVIVNPGVILGKGFSGGSSEIFTAVSNGLQYYTKGATGFVSVHDVIIIMHKLMNGPVQGERFILVGENLSYDKLTLQIAQAMKIKAPSKYAKKWMTQIAWRLDWVASNLFFTKRRLSKSMALSLHSTDLYSNAKIKKETGFVFTPIAETIKIISDYSRR